jgi:hypothetical protein
VIAEQPGAVLSLWAAGIALGAAAVATWKVVGPGFLLLGGGVALLIGGAAAALSTDLPSIGASAAALIGLLLSRRPLLAAAALTLAAAGWGMSAGSAVGWLPTLLGSLALGGITAEMLLGHWYLIDPRLPRSALRRLALAGLVGVVAVGSLVATTGKEGGVAPLAVPVILAAVSGLLMMAVLGALQVKSYTGVMAATGLSYLAVLTALGAVVVGVSLI